MRFFVLGLMTLAVAGCARSHAGDTYNVQKKSALAAAATIVQDDPSPAPSPTPSARVPVVTIPTSYKSSMGLIVLKAEVNYPEMLEFLEWETEDDIQVHSEAIQMKPGYVLAIAESPGPKRMRAIAAIDNRPAVSNWCEIVVGAQPQPDPKPDPTPTPTPPAPVVQKASVATVLDLGANRGPLRGHVMGDVGFWTGVRDAGIDVYLVDWNNKAESTPYVKHVVAAGLGATDSVVVFLDSKMKVLAVEKLPLDDGKQATAENIASTEKDVAALFSKYTGKGKK